MMRLIPLRRVHHGCACWHRDASGSSRLHRVHHGRSPVSVPGRPCSCERRARLPHHWPRHTPDLALSRSRCISCIPAPLRRTFPQSPARPSATPHADAPMRRQAADVAGTRGSRWPVEAPDLPVLDGQGGSLPVIANPREASKRPAPAEVFSVVGTLLSTSSMPALTCATSRSPPAMPIRAPRCATTGPARTWTAARTISSPPSWLPAPDPDRVSRTQPPGDALHCRRERVARGAFVMSSRALFFSAPHRAGTADLHPRWSSIQGMVYRHPCPRHSFRCGYRRWLP